MLHGCCFVDVLFMFLSWSYVTKVSRVRSLSRASRFLPLVLRGCGVVAFAYIPVIPVDTGAYIHLRDV